MKSIVFFFCLFITSVLCFSQKQISFEIPVIKQQNKPSYVEFHQADSMEFSWTVFLGKYKFTDEINLNDESFSYNNLVYSKYAKSYIEDGSEFDSLDSDGFQIFTDYNTSVVYDYDSVKPAKYFFPVYVVNETSRSKYFCFKRSAVFAIQEANIKGKLGTIDMNFWSPIEAKFVNFIASGYRTARVDPGEFILFLMPKYNGSETSLMRVRLRMGENVIVSKSFLGKFNPDQAIMKSDMDFMTNHLLLSKDEIELIGSHTHMLQWLFNGAIPQKYNIIYK